MDRAWLEQEIAEVGMTIHLASENSSLNKQTAKKKKEHNSNICHRVQGEASFYDKVGGEEGKSLDKSMKKQLWSRQSQTKCH